MSNGASVLAQTSIPIGGENCSSVIAGHRSRNGNKYFPDMELLQHGDEVYITNFWETLTYRVMGIKIIDANDVNAILIRKDRDLVTLLTCRPTGSSGLYRCHVFCERVKRSSARKHGRRIFTKENAKLFVCSRYPACNAYLRANKVTKKPIGTPADSSLRRLLWYYIHLFSQYQSCFSFRSICSTYFSIAL